jgi:hypothetical protein
MDIYEKFNKIESREDLVDFLEELMVDLEENRSGWENDTLERYLDGMWGWLQDLDGLCKNKNIPVPEQPSWQLIGRMLLAGKYYE